MERAMVIISFQGHNLLIIWDLFIMVGILQAPNGFIRQYFIEKLSLVPLYLILER